MSTAPYVMSALKTLGQATLSSDWQVVYGSRDAVTVTSNYVMVIRGAVGTDDLVTMELSRSMEEYDVTIELSGSIPGAGDETLQTVSEAVFAAKRSLEHAIRENATGPDLGLSAQGVLQALPRKNSWEFIPKASGEVREALVRFPVHCIGQNT